MSDTKKFEITQPVAIIIAGVLIATAIIFTNTHAQNAETGAAVQQAGQNLPTNVAVVAPNKDDHIIGSPTAPIVLVEYSDFQCPYCSMVYPTIKNIVESSNGQIAWVMRNFPLYQIHPHAEEAANAAECIAEQKGNDGFWKFADAVFNDQANIGPALYTKIATSLGANMTQYNSCTTSKKYQARIDAEAQDAMNNGGNGTPFTVVYGNGKQIPVSGALPAAQFNAVINQVK
ncbi:MAG: protein-disulfide isomerase [Candidatus Adlerbacteria bacterium]|nr:protein-disulfide isomerase [Candidatus Adlerbacteria bacterium]